MPSFAKGPNDIVVEARRLCGEHVGLWVEKSYWDHQEDAWAWAFFEVTMITHKKNGGVNIRTIRGTDTPYRPEEMVLLRSRPSS